MKNEHGHVRTQATAQVEANNTCPWGKVYWRRRSGLAEDSCRADPSESRYGDMKLVLHRITNRKRHTGKVPWSFGAVFAPERRSGQSTIGFGN
jgi:hypothetical protein